MKTTEIIQPRKHTKSEQIVSALTEAMDSGVLAEGARIESVRDIGQRFGASISVVSNALNYLERQGRIERRARSGVYVKGGESANAPWASSVLVCMQPEGHVWGTFFGQVLGELNARSWTAIAMRHDMTLRREPTPDLARQLARVTRQDLRGAIVMGGDYWRNPFLRDFPARRTVFVFELDYPDLCGHGVLVDYEAASHLLCRHLIETGKRRIAFAVPPEALRPGQRRLLHFDQLCNGYERALRECDLAGGARYLTDFDAQNMESVRGALGRLMDEPRPPDAIMCYMDSIAARIVAAAEGAGVEVPTGLAVTGFFHTPWADAGRLKLTTVRFDTADMARRAVDLLAEAPDEPRVTYVKPALRVGAST